MPFNSLLPDAEVKLPLAEIQGDVLIGLKKNAEVFAFFEITDAARFRAELDNVFVDITFSDTLKAIEEAKQSHAIVPFLGFNIAFTIEGLRKLMPGDDLADLDPAFVAGARARGPALGDDVDGWLPEYELAIDGAILATGIDQQTAADHADAIANALRHSVRIVRSESGLVRAAAKGHEHFGFLDGVSQPGVLGLTAPGAKPDQGLPGQDLVKPGEFLLGDYESETGAPVAPPRPWMANGSYLVFRRLNQDVAAFNQYMKAQAGPSGLGSADRLGAHLVGRWKSGAPTVVTPLVDDPGLGADPTRNNDFEFGNADLNQQKCPFVAHIRKVYPRDDFNPEAERRRIIRAGIPFGRDEDSDKGLLFACYQSSIERKFEFLQSTWANNPSFMFNKETSDHKPITPGLDITIGQGSARTPEVGDVPKVRLADAPQFVTAKGAVYLFSPSRSALRQIVEA